MQLTNPQFEILRSHPQSTNLYLSIFQPQAVFKAVVNYPGITKGERIIPYTSVTLGSYLALVPNSTLLIGTTDGGSEVGKIRIKSATSVYITVSENDNIEWANGLFLTGLYYVELWPIFPRIISNPSNAEDVIFYKDWDDAYTNQNSILGTFVNAGPHRAIFRGEQVCYSSAGTYNLVGDSLTYNWAFQGGSPTGSTASNPGCVTYNTPGHFVTRLGVSNASGGVDYTYRYVSVYDRPGQGSDTPVSQWELLSLNGSRDEGGYTAEFRVHSNLNIQENSVVCLFSEDSYGNTDTSLGGNHPNAQKIFFVGYIVSDSIHYDYKHSFVEFSATSLTGLMKSSLGFSVSVESVASPSKWFELKDMDCRRAIYHYLKFHTTALNIGDFQFVGTDKNIQFFDADRNSMYDAVDNLMRETLIGKTVSDRQGKVWMEIDAMAYPSPVGTFTSVMDITKQDWINEPVIEEKFSDSLSYLEYGGIAYDGPEAGTFSAILAAAPGNTPSFRGDIETHEGLALLSQSQLNTLVGNVWANRNAPYPTINMGLGINARNLDIAPQETTSISIAAEDTSRNLNIQGLYIPGRMDWKFDAKNLILLPTIEFRVLVNGVAGETIAVDTTGTGFEVPSLQIPPLPSLTIPTYEFPSGTVSAIVTTNIIQFQSDYGTYYWNGSAISTARGVVLDGVSGIPSSAAAITFHVVTPGIYYVSGWASAYWDSTYGTGIATISWSTSVHSYDGASDIGETVNPSVSAIANLSGGEQISFFFQGSGGGGWTLQNIGMMLFRISA